jgi:alpha-glucan,water dikinase
MHRYNKCFDILNSFNTSSEDDKLIWVYLWLRFSYMRLLDWQRSFNTKPRELAHSMNRLTTEISNKLSPLIKDHYTTWHLGFKQSPFILLRSMLSTLGKGNGDGQKIRDEILQILHKNHIKETNDHFYEQWHQKLHNNTTPDDIVICEALLLFLKSNGDKSVYWDYLNKNGVTRERLAGFERKIVSEPYHNPSYIGDFENFLKTLKAVHSTNDLNLMFESCKYALNRDYNKFDDVMKNKDHWDTLQQIRRVTEAREVLSGIVKDNAGDIGKIRDLLFFDICLEDYVRILVEKIIHVNLSFDLYFDELVFIVRNINTTFRFEEMATILDDWINIGTQYKGKVGEGKENNINSILKMKSILDRFSRCLSHVVDYYNTHFDPKAKYLGTKFKCEKYVVDIFTEEIIRGSVFFSLSMILKKIEPIFRKYANLSPWHIISPGQIGLNHTGTVEFVKTLKEVQFKTYPKKTILLTEVVGGNEEVPVNVSALIMVYSRDYPDVLSHVGVRARNLNIPFLACFEDSISDEIKALTGKKITFKISNQKVDYDYSTSNGKDEEGALNGLDGSSEKKVYQNTFITDDFTSVFIELIDFDKTKVGGKSNNTKRVLNNLPDYVKYPESFAIPFNVFEYFLNEEENKSVKAKLSSLMSSIEESTKREKIPTLLEQCRKVVNEMKINTSSDVEGEKLKARLLKFGIQETEIEKAFNAIKEVWASKFNERVFISVGKIGISINNIKMAILVQKIIPAEYAFVIHTKNPASNDENELYAEVVYGMGEALVGFHEGQAFSFTFNKSNLNYFNIFSHETVFHQIISKQISGLT